MRIHFAGSAAAAVLLAAAGWALPAGQAAAATIDCASGPVDRSGFVQSSYDCSGVYGGSSADDAQGLFGHSGWAEHGTIMIPKKGFSGGSDGGLDIAGGNLSGGWSIDAGLLDAYESVMLVLMGGKKKSPDMMAYLVDAAEGTYDSPFLNGKKAKQLKISGFMLFLGPERQVGPPGGEDPGYDGNGDYPAPVPLPAAGLLMLGALGGLGLLARRRRRAA